MTRFSMALRTAAAATALGAAAAFLSAGTAAAEDLAPRTATVATVDGWDVSVTASDLSVRPVPNLAGSPFTREGFVSATVTGEVHGQGTAPVRSGTVEQGIQIGCGVDVSSGATLGLNATFGPNVGITMAGPGPVGGDQRAHRHPRPRSRRPSGLTAAAWTGVTPARGSPTHGSCAAGH